MQRDQELQSQQVKEDQNHVTLEIDNIYQELKVEINHNEEVKNDE